MAHAFEFACGMRKGACVRVCALSHIRQGESLCFLKQGRERRGEALSNETPAPAQGKRTCLCLLINRRGDSLASLVSFSCSSVSRATSFPFGIRCTPTFHIMLIVIFNIISFHVHELPDICKCTQPLRKRVRVLVSVSVSVSVSV